MNRPAASHISVLLLALFVAWGCAPRPSMFNPAGETLDYPKAREAFEHVAHLPPREIIDRLVLAGEEWAGGRTLEGDVTFVVLKVK